MAGNILGRRSYYRYTGDDGQNYSLLMDDSLAAAVGATLDATSPNPPRRFEPRGVYVEALINNVRKRKFLICPGTDTAPYDTNISTNVTIDTVIYGTTGRVGEKLSFPRNIDAVDPGDDDGTV